MKFSVQGINQHSAIIGHADSDGTEPRLDGASWIAQKLQEATAQLQDADRPPLLKIATYLQICCDIMQKAYPQVAALQGMSYHALMKSLFEHNARWWQTCRVTVAGKVQSDDPIVNSLLQPLQLLHQ